MFTGYSDATVDFMWGIRFNNERAWFEANKETYLTHFQQPMRELAARGEMKSFYHEGFWQCMDTKREKELLERYWAEGRAPWKVWSD